MKEWYKKWWAIALFIIVGLMIFGSLLPDENTSENFEQKEAEKPNFNEIAIQSLYDNGFCYEEMFEEEGKECGEAEYPFIRVYNAEDFTEAGKMLLITQVSEDLYEQLPELYNIEIVFIFRDINQNSVDRIYVEENKWER